MLLLVGLGNPGPKHAGQRHNIGFMAVERIADRHRFQPWRTSRFQGVTAEGEIAGVKALALEPQTYMNESGQAVGQLLRFFKAAPAAMTVFHDELDLAPGRVRVKRGGGHGGHNGLRSLDAHVGPDYRRVRLGIGHPGDKDRVLPWVLGDFTGGERLWLDRLLDALAEHAPLLAGQDDAAFASRVAQTLDPPKPRAPKPAQTESGSGS
jgi:PTH1 family peptidyl-tRNA hydrolase